jgi:predicted transcriptional regulator
VARALGISQPAVSKMEHAGADWRLSTVMRYADAVGLVVVLAEVSNVG